MFVDFVLIGGIFFLLFIILFLLKTRQNLSKKLLIVFFANSIFFLLYYYAYRYRSHSLGAIALLFGNGAGFLLGPVMLFYLRSLFLPKERILGPLLKHLIPYFTVWFCISLPLAISVGTDYLDRYNSGYALVADYINLAENLYFFVYIWLSYRLAKRINTACYEQYAFIDKNGLDWFRQLMTGFMVIIVADSLLSVYELLYIPPDWNVGTIIAFGFVALYSYLGYKGLFQSRILLPDILFEGEEQVSEISPTSNEDSQLNSTLGESFTEEEIEQLQMKLEELLDSKKIYLNESLSLTDLALEMGIPNKKLSGFLNQYLQVNFYTLINDYRVREFKEKLEQPESDKYTLLGIAYDSGFQSKASFNRVFKQKTGMSPSKYRKSRHQRNVRAEKI